MALAPDAHDGRRIEGGAPSTAASAVEIAERACCAAVEGRQAARALAEWARRYGLREPDFQVLWSLRSADAERLDQSTLASRLALSPAQISMTVDRLGAKGWITCAIEPDDRRRKLRQLTADGQSLLAKMLADNIPLRFEPSCTGPLSSLRLDQHEEAA
jgi:DNA-binding MarR family transcriptional regulator